MEEQVLGGLGERERSTLLPALRKLVRQR